VTRLRTIKRRCEACDGRGHTVTADPAALRARRKLAGLGLRQLARSLELSPSYISDIERGKRNATQAIVEVYAAMVPKRRAPGK
jgi:predicted transcriptional regulator